MFDFTKVAKEETSLSELMIGRTKKSVDDVIRENPDGITINCFEVVSTIKDTFPVITFKENDSVFFFGGVVIMKIIDAWKREGKFERYDDCADALHAAGGCHVKMMSSKTKGGQNITLVSVE